NALTITAQDAYGNTDTSYTGDHSLTFSGANASTSPVTQPTVTNKTPSAVNFGTATTITFASGVNSAGGTMKLYKVETAAIAVTDGTISQAATLTVSVNAAAASKFALTGAASQTAGANNALTITAQDAYGNTDISYSGDHALTFSGANASANPLTQPTLSPYTTLSRSFGTATTITFASGVNSAGG